MSNLLRGPGGSPLVRLQIALYERNFARDFHDSCYKRESSTCQNVLAASVCLFVRKIF